ncbi:hypothetical protein D3C71_617980 [compost metagenome]
MEYNKKLNTVNGEPVGPLGLAYEFGTLEYTLAYFAFNLLFEHLEKHPAAVEELVERFGVPEERVWSLAEDLFTDNADPDSVE